MSDCCDEKLINASDLIEWIMETYPDWCVYPIRGVVDKINEMPSKDIQDSRFGYWIESGYDEYDYTCSECGKPCVGCMDRFCRWCGARMS